MSFDENLNFENINEITRRNDHSMTQEADDDAVVDSDDSVESEKRFVTGKHNFKKALTVTYNRSTLKMGKVRKFKYVMKNIGSLCVSCWVREEGEKDDTLSTSSSNFKREYSKRRVKQFQHFF